jgi:hypothetical protein
MQTSRRSIETSIADGTWQIPESGQSYRLIIWDLPFEMLESVGSTSRCRVHAERSARQVGNPTVGRAQGVPWHDPGIEPNAWRTDCHGV